MSNRRKPNRTQPSQPPPPTDGKNAFWNGLPTYAQRGTAVVLDAPEFPQYWARDLVGQRIEVVRVVLDGVNYGGGIDYLDNRDGSGWRKVTEGHGSPAYPSAHLAVRDFLPDPRKGDQ
jgi:hypothetical protein